MSLIEGFALVGRVPRIHAEHPGIGLSRGGMRPTAMLAVLNPPELPFADAKRRSRLCEGCGSPELPSMLMRCETGHFSLGNSIRPMVPYPAHRKQPQRSALQEHVMKITNGAWIDKAKTSIITKTPDGGRLFQRLSQHGWKTYESRPPTRRRSRGGRS